MRIGPPKFPPNWFWLFSGLRRWLWFGEAVVGVEVVVAQVLIRKAVELVGAALGVDRDRGAGRASIFGRIRIGDDVELGDDVYGRVSGLGAEFLHIFRESVVVDAVEDEVVLQRVDAVDVKVAGAASRRGTTLLRDSG